MAKLTLSNVTNLQNEASAIATLAANNTATAAALENTLSRDGTSPNTMGASLDMNSHTILNLPDPTTDQEPVTKGYGDDHYGDSLTSANNAAASATAAATSATSAATSATASASSATSSATSATASASSATSASSSASTATTQASAAATSATAAASSATSASSSASTATTQASNASTSASNASTSATNAASSATSASSSASAASSSATAAASSATAAANSATSTNKSGLNYTFSTSTSMANPGAGTLRLNNATLSSVSAAALMGTTSDTGNPSVQPYLITWDDSTSTIKGYVNFRKASAPENFALYSISALTDNTTWVQLSLTYVTSSGSFSNSDALIAFFDRTGDAGSGTISGMSQYGIPVAANATTVSASLAPIAGGVLASTSASANPAFSATPTLGASGTLGTIAFGNATSGTITLSPVAGALGTVTLSLPAATDTIVGKATTDTLTNKTLTSPTLTTPVLGTPSSGTLTNCSGLPVSGITASTSTALGVGSVELGHATDTTISRASAGVIAVEGVNLTPNIPITSKSAAYTVVLGDANTCIYHPSSDNNARTFTIDSNANVAYPVGTCLSFINDINTVTVAITSDTLVLGGTGSTGSRTLAANGVATAVKVASTKWYITGSGLT